MSNLLLTHLKDAHGLLSAHFIFVHATLVWIQLSKESVVGGAELLLLSHERHDLPLLLLALERLVFFFEVA